MKIQDQGFKPEHRVKTTDSTTRTERTSAHGKPDWSGGSDQASALNPGLSNVVDTQGKLPGKERNPWNGVQSVSLSTEPATSAAASTETTTETEGTDKAEHHRKGRRKAKRGHHGKPAWAGGPQNATALPPGLAKQYEKRGEIPGQGHNPWSRFEAILKEAAAKAAEEAKKAEEAKAAEEAEATKPSETSETTTEPTVLVAQPEAEKTEVTAS